MIPRRRDLECNLILGVSERNRRSIMLLFASNAKTIKIPLKIDYKNRYKYTKSNLISKYRTRAQFQKLKKNYLCNVFCSLWNVIYLKRHCQILFLSIRKHMLFVCVTVLYITVHRPQAKRHVTFDRTCGSVSNVAEHVKRDRPCCDGVSLGLRSGRVGWT